MIVFEFQGDEQVEAILDALKTPGFLKATFEEIGAQVNTDLAKYPPQRPAIQGPQSHPVRFTTKEGKDVSFIARARPQYRRTGTLGRTWTHKEYVSLYSIATVIGNVTPYARFVQGAEDQADMHKNWWKTTEEVLQEREQWIIDQVLDAIQSRVADQQ